MKYKEIEEIIRLTILNFNRDINKVKFSEIKNELYKV